MGGDQKTLDWIDTFEFLHLEDSLLAPSRSSRSHNVRSFLVCLELLFFIFWHQILQDDFRSVSGQSQVSLRAVSGLSVLTSSDRRSLKYFVLLSYPRIKVWFKLSICPCRIGHVGLHTLLNQ